MAQNLRNKHGIDIAVAMEFLSERQQQNAPTSSTLQRPRNQQQEAWQHAIPTSNEESSGKCACCQKGDMNVKNLAGGQVIDLYASDDRPPTATDAQIETFAEQVPTTMPERDQQEQQDRFKQEISTLTLKQRIQIVLQAQQDRVATYRRFDEGLQDVLSTGNITMYPAICAQVTATFAVLSNTINAVRDAPSPVNSNNDLNQHKHLTSLLKQLQKHESEKLNLTAALHLEKMRKASATTTATGDDENVMTTTTTTLNMLQSGIDSLRQKISNCVSDINQVLEELQCLLLDEECDDEEE